MSDPEDNQTQSPKANDKKLSYFAVHGRRKGAVARVRLYKGNGENSINDKSPDQYFALETEKIVWQKPFNLTKSQGQYYVTIKVKGSGKASQLDAIVHGLSRSLILANPDFRPILKKAGLLTRDPRVRERRKYGLAQKARKGKQSPKR